MAAVLAGVASAVFSICADLYFIVAMFTRVDPQTGVAQGRQRGRYPCLPPMPSRLIHRRRQSPMAILSLLHRLASHSLQ